MNKLTSREIRLLFVLALVIVVVGGTALWIMPLNTANEALRIENQDLSSQKMVMENTVPRINDLAAQLEERKIALNESLTQISAPINNGEFNETVNGIAGAYGLVVTTITFQEVAAIAPSASSPAGEVVEYELKAIIDQYRNDMAETGTSTVSDYQILKQSVLVEVDGAIGQVEGFIDGLNAANKTLYVSSLTYDENNAHSTLILDIYSIDQISLTE